MSISRYFSAGLLGLAIAVSTVPAAPAQTLRVMTDKAARTLKVPMNRAVVVESDEPFAELSVANPAIADIATLSDRTMYVLGKSPGRTTLTLLSPDGKLIANVDVQVEADLSELKQRLREILPGEKIEVRAANDGIVLSGSASSIARMNRALALAERYAPKKNVTNLMTVGGTQQVLLKVRFAEMQRSVSKNLTGNLAIGQGGTNGIGALGSNTGATDTSLLGVTNSTQNLITGSATQRIGAFGVGFTAGSFELSLLLEALESKGMVRTLAEPNLSALSGQLATFLAGGEYPIPVLGDNGAVTIEYKPFGVELNFTPTVVDNDIINLKIDAAVSGIDTTITIQNGGFSINAFKTRKATTTVEMRDGESLAIAGLLQDDFTDLVGQVPWIGDIPILGALFRSSEYQKKQSELVIVVTPHLVTPTRGEAFMLPTDRVRPPTEAGLFLNGNIAAKAGLKGAAGEVARQDFDSSYGYVME
ncbi:MAG: type II and III secretion system protein family protein [Alphaproteobacteria bacterium]|nr:MAG: type II and III secretion system protein family protein [Alphaproteobacteria bacterium]